jgi:hypothetical protein
MCSPVMESVIAFSTRTPIHRVQELPHKGAQRAIDARLIHPPIAEYQRGTSTQWSRRKPCVCWCRTISPRATAALSASPLTICSIRVNTPRRNSSAAKLQLSFLLPPDVEIALVG